MIKMIIFIIIVAILFGIVIGLLINQKTEGPDKSNLTKMKIFRSVLSATYDSKTEVLKIEYSDGTTATYHGSSTVWYTYPMMHRCSTSTEVQLCDIYKYIKVHGNPYPTAHNKQL